MKTNTYMQFKNFVKNTCINKFELCSGGAYYSRDSAHAIYTAWYIFKHRLAGDEINNYIREDYQKTRKHFCLQGAWVSVNITENDVNGEMRTEWVDKKDALVTASCNFYGGAYYDSSEVYWVETVRKIYDFWKNKLDEEQLLEELKTLEGESIAC